MAEYLSPEEGDEDEADFEPFSDRSVERAAFAAPPRGLRALPDP